MKILYAAGNNSNSLIQLSRFVQAVEDKPFQLKIAAYKKYSPSNINVDWTLDCLLDIITPDHLLLNNDNLNIYYEQVKYYSPDLVISDLEYFTSSIANVLNIKLWQCSSSFLDLALYARYKRNIVRRYYHLMARTHFYDHQQIHIIDTSDRNFVYSHFGDLNNPPDIKNNFEWIRPYHEIGKISAPCRHNIVAGLVGNNKKILSLLKKQTDCVVFTDFCQERYANLWIKDIYNLEEYYCNLKNSNLFVCEGQASFLADAFYNNRYAVVMPNFADADCVFNGLLSEKLGLSSCVYSVQDLQSFTNRSITRQNNPQIKMLHEKIEEIL